jgi:hypothetical protein
MTEQKVVGGIPQNQLTAGDIVDFWGAIVGGTSEGDLISWQQDTNELNVFTLDYKLGLYQYADTITDDFAGRDLDFVMEYCDFNF